MASSEKRFYDIHMHVFNLSHAGLMAFINRFFLNNALNFNDLLDGKYFKILRYYFFKKGYSKAENRALLRVRRKRISFFIILFLAWAFLWFYCIPQYLYFSFAHIWNCWSIILSWVIYVCGFVFSPVLLFLLYLLAKWPVKKLFCKKGKSRSIPRTINVLSVFENDLAHQLRYLELDYLSFHEDIRNYIFNAGNPGPDAFYTRIGTMWEDHRKNLKINGQEINKVILTPLMMNFNSKGFEGLDKKKVHYNLPPAKLIIEQLIDLFNGIQNYCRNYSLKLFEIYPFMGINPESYRRGGALKIGRQLEIPDALEGKVVFLSVIDVLVFVRKMDAAEQDMLLAAVDDSQLRENIRVAMEEFHSRKFKSDGYPRDNTFPKMLDKYFGEYRGDADDFSRAFHDMFIAPDGPKTWRDIRSNFFSGIKVYPPLGFDPYPLETPDKKKLEKAKSQEEREFLEENALNVWVNTHFLYQYCIKKNIPMTTHCSDGGFVIMDEDWSRERANPEFWMGVLNFYPELKLNFGHFGIQVRSEKDSWGRWNSFIIDMILNDDCPNVYADISDLGATTKKYDELGKAIKGYISIKAKGDAHKKDLFKEKLYRNLLFGTDFMVNLFGTDSYLAYIMTYEETGIFTKEEKINLATENPHRFLFEDK